MTNTEKFIEIFKVAPDTECCVLKCPKPRFKCKYYKKPGDCSCDDWWDEEYKEPRKMTKNEAIEWLESRKEHYELDDDENCQALAEALSMGIEALKQKNESQPPRPSANALEVGACKSSD